MRPVRETTSGVISPLEPPSTLPQIKMEAREGFYVDDNSLNSTSMLTWRNVPGMRSFSFEHWWIPISSVAGPGLCSFYWMPWCSIPSHLPIDTDLHIYIYRERENCIYLLVCSCILRYLHKAHAEILAQAHMEAHTSRASSPSNR